MICHLREKGELLVQQSCTETLQSFHRPQKRRHTSPVRASSLGKGLKDDDDPRPAKFKNRPSYQDEVNMLTLNYCSNLDRDSSWRFKFGKADLQQAAQDHFYDTLPLTEL